MLVVLMAHIDGVAMEQELSREVLQYMGDAYGEAMSISIRTALVTGLAVSENGPSPPMDIGRFMVTSVRENEVRESITKLMDKEGLTQVIAKDLPEEWQTMEAEDEK